MSQFVSSINLQLSPDSISQGEQAIRQEIALQLYDQNIFTFGQARRLANLYCMGISATFRATKNSTPLY